MAYKTQKIICAVLVAFAILICMILTIELTARRLFLKKIHALYPDSTASHVVLYADGLVARQVVIKKTLRLQTLYLKGDPFRLLAGKPLLIWIKQADLNVTRLPQNKIAWPVPDNVNFSVEKIQVILPVWDKIVTLSGNIKHDNNARIVYDLRTDTPDFAGTVQGEAIVKNRFITDLNIELDEGHLRLIPFMARRIIAWANLSYKNIWQISAEANAGSMEAGPFSLLDASLKLNGALSDPVVSFSALEKHCQESWTLDRVPAASLLLQRGEDETISQISLKDQTGLTGWLQNLAANPRPCQRETSTDGGAE